MRQNYPRPQGNALFWLISAIIAGFVLQLLLSSPVIASGRAGVYGLLELNADSFKSGRLWTLFTYSFLNDPRNLLAVIGNVVALYFLGRELVPLLGNKRFLGLYSSAVVVGGLAWMAAHWTSGQSLMGATAGVIALLTVFACFYPNQQITLLLFFIFPVTIKPKYLVYGLLAFDLLGLVFYEILGSTSPFQFAHSAHLGGMLAGWIYYRYIHNAEWRLPWRKVDVQAPAWVKKAAQNPTVAQPVYQVDLSNRAHVRAEVDRILDKINAHGFGSLTADEKRLLDEAKDLLSRR